MFNTIQIDEDTLVVFSPDRYHAHEIIVLSHGQPIEVWKHPKARAILALVRREVTLLNAREADGPDVWAVMVVG